MNVFVLSTGRCGSETFMRACRHMTNYTAEHESHNRWIHPRLAPPYRDLRFPDRHIEVDNRLSWFLGTLEKTYGAEAYYVHLLRDRDEVARSLARRGSRSILYAFASGILQYYDDVRRLTADEWLEVGRHYWDCVNDNISLFLRDKPHRFTMWLHDIEEPFSNFWHAIGAEGDLSRALGEWRVHHNASRMVRARAHAPAHELRRNGAASDWQSRVDAAVYEIMDVVPQGESFILADDAQWGLSRVVVGRRQFPFTERDGHYAGPPADATAAIRELQRLEAAGARYFVLGWPALAWFAPLPEFEAYLQSRDTYPLRTSQITVFDLRQPSSRHGCDHASAAGEASIARKQGCAPI